MARIGTYVGPTTMDCAEQCVVPDGATLSWVPPPRHNWGDIFHCPNDGCDRYLLVIRSPEAAKDATGGQG